jgi:hypothetical protein
MDKRPLHIGDVVQIDPAHDERFGGCLMMVTEPKSWGAQGFISTPAHSGRYYYRCKFEHMEYVGATSWVPQDETEGEDNP